MKSTLVALLSLIPALCFGQITVVYPPSVTTVNNGTLSGNTVNTGTISGGTISGASLASVTLTGLTTNTGTVSGGTVNAVTLQVGGTNVNSAAFLSAQQTAALGDFVQTPALEGLWLAGSVTSGTGAAVTSWPPVVGGASWTGTATKGISTYGGPAIAFSGTQRMTLAANSFSASGFATGFTVICMVERATSGLEWPWFQVSDSTTDRFASGDNNGGWIAGNGGHAVMYNITKPHVYAVTFSSTSNMYSDGVKDSLPFPQTYINPTPFTWVIGQTSAAFTFQGKVMAMAVFSRVLTDAEIQSRTNQLFAYSVPPQLLPQGVIDGDSIAAGNVIHTNDSWAYLLSGTLGTGFNLVNIAVGGKQAVAATADFPTRVTPVLPRGTAFYFPFIGGNDMDSVLSASGTYTAAQAYANYAALLAQGKAQGVPTIAATLLPRSNAGFNTKRNAFNALVYAGIADGTLRADVLCDFAAEATIGPDAAASNATYYGDGVHPTAAANLLMLPLAYSAAFPFIARMTTPVPGFGKISGVYSGTGTLAASSLGALATLNVDFPISGITTSGKYAWQLGASTSVPTGVVPMGEPFVVGTGTLRAQFINVNVTGVTGTATVWTVGNQLP